MGKNRIPVTLWAFWLPGCALLAALVFYVARGGEVTSSIPNGHIDLSQPSSPCLNPNDCLEPSPALVAAYNDAGACAPTLADGLRLCLALLGDVHPELVAHVVDYYESEHGLAIRVLPPLAIPQELLPIVEPQYSADWLMELVRDAYPAESMDADVRLIALTAVDIWLEGRTRWSWAFGQLSSPPGRGQGYVHGIISVYRMDSRSWGPFYSEDAFYGRVRKMMNKYVAVTYFGLPMSSDPTSVTYNNILSVRDLDLMADRIPVP